nr:hypothetical protein [Tanacetum cinerariifolium]
MRLSLEPLEAEHRVVAVYIYTGMIALEELWRSPSAGCGSSVSSSTKGAENGNGGICRLVLLWRRAQPKDFMATKKE